MKNNVFTKKLKSNTGASILLALMFFLICFFVASVVMASASVNASRALAQKEEQRSYFAIQSAENLIKSMFTEINGANRVDNRRVINNEDDGVSARAIGGFHLRDQKTSYSSCNCTTRHDYYGLWTSSNGGESGVPIVVKNGSTGVIKFTTSPEGMPESSFASYGINCIGNKGMVFLESELEEVAMYAMSKRLYDDGTHNLDLTGGKSYTKNATMTAFENAFKSLYVSKDKSFKDLVYEFDIQPSDNTNKHQSNLPTVHVKMTTDEKANLTFRLSVDSKFASTYSGTLTAHSSFESLTPPGYTSTPERKSCPHPIGEVVDAEHTERVTVVDTYLSWYTDDIEVSKGLKPETSGEASTPDAGDIT